MPICLDTNVRWTLLSADVVFIRGLGDVDAVAYGGDFAGLGVGLAVAAPLQDAGARLPYPFFISLSATRTPSVAPPSMNP